MTPAATAEALRSAENELQTLRARLAQVVAFIHDPTTDHHARTALAQRLGLPVPRTTTPLKEA